MSIRTAPVVEPAPKAVFRAALAAAYAALLDTPKFAIAKSKGFTGSTLADTMMAGLEDGTSDWNGEGVKRACLAVGISHTRKAILAFLHSASPCDLECGDRFFKGAKTCRHNRTATESIESIVYK